MIELGIILAFGVAAMKGLQSVYQRKNALGTDEFVTAWSSRVFGLPVLGIAIFFQGVPELGADFFLLAAPQAAVIALASVLIAKAYKKSDASIVTPMFALSPILVAGTSFIILSETPSLTGLFGIALITLGAYLLKIKDAEKLLDPIKNLWEERGVQIILVVILIYSITANIDKIGVQQSSPVMWPLTVYLLSSIFMTPLMIKKSSNWKNKIQTDWKPLSLLGILGAASIFLQMTAIKLTLVSYVIAIKRLSIPITVILSLYLLNEKDSFRERIGGSILMVIGAILITL
jgi:drug/metabolite transporter (DMT)-like permease